MASMSTSVARQLQSMHNFYGPAKLSWGLANLRVRRQPLLYAVATAVQQRLSESQQSSTKIAWCSVVRAIPPVELWVPERQGSFDACIDEEMLAHFGKNLIPRLMLCYGACGPRPSLNTQADSSRWLQRGIDLGDMSTAVEDLTWICLLQHTSRPGPCQEVIRKYSCGRELPAWFRVQDGPWSKSKAKYMQRFSNLEKFAQPASGNHWEKLGAVIDFVEHRLSAAAPQVPGTVNEMLRLLDTFAQRREHWLKVAGGAKAEVALECGTFIGSRTYAKGVDPVQACIARHLVDLAGASFVLSGGCHWTGEVRDIVPKIVELFGATSVGMVFMDYKEDTGAIGINSRLLADNVALPGAPLLLWNLAFSPSWELTAFAMTEFHEPNTEDWMALGRITCAAEPAVSDLQKETCLERTRTVDRAARSKKWCLTQDVLPQTTMKPLVAEIGKVARAMRQLAGRLALAAVALASEDYMARVDPSLHTWTRTVRVAEDAFLLLEMHQGNLKALLNGEAEVDLPQEQEEQLLSAFPAEALTVEARVPQIQSQRWAAKILRHAVGARVDPDCAVNTENHLEKEILAVFRRLRNPPIGSVLTFGGLYGGVHGEGVDVPDDPAVELMLELQQRGAGKITDSRAGVAALRTLNIPDPLRWADLQLPAEFAGELDLLRLDGLRHGVSCEVLRQVRPRLVALLVLSQVPPPFQYFPLGVPGYNSPPALMSCSLSGAIEVLAKHDLFLIRLTGPYALFVRQSEWPEALPINEFDCYRRASVWGLKDIPLSFVREWLREEVDQVLPRLWRNLTHLHSDGGPFTLVLFCKSCRVEWIRKQGGAMDAMEVATMAAPLVSSTSSVHPGRWRRGTTLSRSSPATSFGQRSADSASSTWHTGWLASTAIVGLAASRPTRRRLQSRQLRQTRRAGDSPVVLEVKEVEAKSTDEDEKQILKGLNLTIRAGEVHAVMGPNGSGKSTLAKVLIGDSAYEVTNGSAKLGETDLLEMEPHERALEGLFLAFQSPPAVGGVSNLDFLRAAYNAQSIFAAVRMSSGIRRRKVPGSEADEGLSNSGALETLRKFDVYNKVHEDYMQKRQLGGAVTLVTCAILAVLVYCEVCEFFSVEVLHSITVDTNIDRKLPISLDITFPHLRCSEVSVDTVDSAGDTQVDAHGGLDMHNLDAAGKISTGDPVASKGDCWPCLEAEDAKHKCCNSCQELKDAYNDKELPYFHVLDTAMQCKSSIGCRIKGKVVVNKVSGNIHVALGKSVRRDGKLVHEFNIEDIGDGFNTSHHIHSITFGEYVYGLQSPLEGIRKIAGAGSWMYHYYVKLVPTVYISRWGTTTYTNQYSVTDSARNVQVREGELSGLPGVFLVYDFSPFLMQQTEQVKPWSYVFTSMCAIVGGAFSVATLVEMALSSAREEPELDVIEFYGLVTQKLQDLKINPDFLNRNVNEGFSGGERKRNEMLQMAVLQPKLAILDEIDSGLDIDALKDVAEAIRSVREQDPDRAMLVVTHFERFLRYVEADHVHVMYQGRILKSGGKELADKLDEEGYDWVLKEAK
ncbi:Endoplasmic reticulum-Golgi intermediate compartment protein 3 [Symbiodinium microadriaticum]|uniref:Endoplasmic reticulum-Golgi intermediate compartment protein 3 n=1 Tax=Symbiodinium microadriaticum TaxID=2951 RepID=A0A1Q9CQ97_SYMMI|nr:Endoplasmic reticulum-Golgi intermediate compartment protein 3 [Symbiodinium microadriaticum]